MTPEQQAALDAARARLSKPSADESLWDRFRQTKVGENLIGYGEVDTPGERLGQYLGGVAGHVNQGVFMQWADEIAARAMAVNPNTTYEKELAKIRARLRVFQEENPKTAITAEVLGAIGASMVPGGVALKAGGPVLKTAAVAGTGATLGGITGAGMSEEKGMDRLPDAVLPAVAGGVLAPVAAGVGYGLGRLTNFARAKWGNSAGRAVEREVNRLADLSGKTADEIVDDLASGRLMTDNVTLKTALRGYATQGDEAAQILRRELPERAETLRGQVMQDIQEGLVGRQGNVSRMVREGDEVVKAAEREAYAPFATMPASERLVSEAGEALKRVPAAADEVAEVYRAQTGKAPFFRILEDGQVIFDRQPTVRDIEIIRRATANTASGRYRAGQGAAGEAISEVEGALRSGLDEVEGLAAVRAQAGIVRGARDAYKAGRKAFSMGPDEASLAFEDAVKAGTEAVESFRAGVMSELRKRYAGAQRNNLMKKLNEPSSREGSLLRVVFPDESAPSLLEKLKLTTDAGEVAQTVMGGSSTAANLAEQSNIGSTVGRIITGDTQQLALEAIGQALKGRGLSGDQRRQVVDLVLSSDPQVLSQVLKSGPETRKLIEGAMSQLGFGAGVGLLSGVQE